MEQTLKKIGEWVVSGDTGASSKFLLCCFLGGNPTMIDWPLDPSDFGRCYRFLELLPKEYKKETLKQAARLSEKWFMLVNNWACLEEIYLLNLHEEDKKQEILYRKMKELLS